MKAPPKAAIDDLVLRAIAARERAHAPYSRFRVGAAILTKKGEVFAGCNVENASFGACICAERNAICQMVAAGAKDPIACAVVTSGRGASPCGICRQVLAEFARDMTLVLVGLEGGKVRRRTSTLKKLLPDSFTAFEGEPHR